MIPDLNLIFVYRNPPLVVGTMNSPLEQVASRSESRLRRRGKTHNVSFRRAGFARGICCFLAVAKKSRSLASLGMTSQAFAAVALDAHSISHRSCPGKRVCENPDLRGLC